MLRVSYGSLVWSSSAQYFFGCDEVEVRLDQAQCQKQRCLGPILQVIFKRGKCQLDFESNDKSLPCVSKKPVSRFTSGIIGA